MRKHIVLAEPGGVYTPEQIKRIVSIVKKGSIEGLHFGERQEILFAPHYSARAHNKREVASLSCWSLSRHEYNPMCSQVCGGLSGVLDWAYEEDAYREILDGLKSPPTFRVGLLHPDQKLLPRLANEFNAYPSEETGFWKILLNFEGERVLLPRLIPTDSVVRWIEMTEQALSENTVLEDLPLLLSEAMSEDWPLTKSLTLPSHSHEDVEGFMPMSSGRLALNLYNNHHPWSLSFLGALMDLAQSRDIAQVYVTTGRSLLIKHIKKTERLMWEGLLSRHNMTIRHSGADLAWIVGSHLPRNVTLKRRLQNRLALEGLAFSQTQISIDPPKIDDRATLYIRRHGHWYGQRYELLYKRNFNPLSETCMSMGRELSFSELVEQLIKVHRDLYARPAEGESVVVQPFVYRSSK